MLTITITKSCIRTRMIDLIANRFSTRGQIKTIFLISAINRGSSITAMSTEFLTGISSFFDLFRHQLFTCNFTHFNCITTTPSSSASIITCLSGFTNDPIFSFNRKNISEVRFSKFFIKDSKPKKTKCVG